MGYELSSHIVETYCTLEHDWRPILYWGFKKLPPRGYGFGRTRQKPQIHTCWPTASPERMERSLAGVCPPDALTFGREPEVRQKRVSKEIPHDTGEALMFGCGPPRPRPEMTLMLEVIQVRSIRGDDNVLLISAKRGERGKHMERPKRQGNTGSLAMRS